MAELLLLGSLLLIAAGIFLFIVGFFKPPPESDFDAAFRVSVDNLNRRAIFDIPELRPVLWPFHQLARRVAIERLRRRILRNLRASGNPNAYSPDEFLTLCLVCGIGAGLGLVILHGLLMGDGPNVLVLIVGFIIGFMLCDYVLAATAHKRLRRINVQLPYALDLLAMTMKAGATFYEAARTVSEEDPQEPLNQELGIVVREIEFGRSRQEALQHFVERIPLPALNSIIAAVLQAEQLGTPLAEVLELQANLLRMYRSMRAEETLGKATVRLLVPSLLIFISVILIVFGPILVRILRNGLW